MDAHTQTLTDLSDAELVSRCLDAGQRYDDAFEVLYARYSARVFGFLLKVTRRREAAEDALQETFLRVHRSLERFDTGRDLMTWLLQIARYVAIDAHRVEAKVKRLEERTAQDRGGEGVSGEAEDVAKANESKQLVDDAMASLSLDDRSLLLLRHYQELTFREIGESTDCSSRTAQNRVEAAAKRFQYALLRLRKERSR